MGIDPTVYSHPCDSPLLPPPFLARQPSTDGKGVPSAIDQLFAKSYGLKKPFLAGWTPVGSMPSADFPASPLSPRRLLLHAPNPALSALAVKTPVSPKNPNPLPLQQPTDGKADGKDSDQKVCPTDEIRKQLKMLRISVPTTEGATAAAGAVAATVARHSPVLPAKPVPMRRLRSVGLLPASPPPALSPPHRTMATAKFLAAQAMKPS